MGGWARSLVLIGAVICATPPAMAQDSLEIPPPILTIDQDRLFAETDIGAEAIAELEARGAALAEENNRIEAELIRQERELTDQRPTLAPEEFRELADAFDARVQALRDEQDEKTRNITRARDVARQNFLTDVADIVSEIVRARGALVVLDRRDVFLSADHIDITDEAIRRVNAAAADSPSE